MENAHIVCLHNHRAFPRQLHILINAKKMMTVSRLIVAVTNPSWDGVASLLVLAAWLALLILSLQYLVVLLGVSMNQPAAGMMRWLVVNVVSERDRRLGDGSAATIT